MECASHGSILWVRRMTDSSALVPKAATRRNGVLVNTRLSALWAALSLLLVSAGILLADDEIRVTNLLLDAETATAEGAVGEMGLAGDCCYDHCGPSWFAGAEMTFMGYDARTGGRITMTLDDTGTAGTDYSVRDGNNAQSLAYTPRIWIGRKFGEKWGVVGPLLEPHRLHHPPPRAAAGSRESHQFRHQNGIRPRPSSHG